MTLIRVLCRHHFRISPRVRAAWARPGGDDAGLRCRAADRRSGVRGRSRRARASEDRSRGRVDGDDRAAVRLCGVDRPRRARSPETTSRALQDAQREGAGSPSMRLRRNTRTAMPRSGRRAARYLRDNVKYGLGAEEAAGLQLFLDYAADLGLAPQRRPAGILLDDRAHRAKGPGRRPRRRGRGARAVPPRADTAARPSRRYDPRPQAS